MFLFCLEKQKKEAVKGEEKDLSAGGNWEGKSQLWAKMSKNFLPSPSFTDKRTIVFPSVLRPETYKVLCFCFLLCNKKNTVSIFSFIRHPKVWRGPFSSSILVCVFSTKVFFAFDTSMPFLFVVYIYQEKRVLNWQDVLGLFIRVVFLCSKDTCSPLRKRTKETGF